VIKPETDKGFAPGRRLEFFRKDPRVKLPSRAMDDAVGFDIYAFLLTESGRPSTKMVPQKNTVAIPTGIVVKPPPGFFVQCCSRSGLAMKSLFVANAPGIIDPDYTGEILVLLFNGSYETQYVQHEQRIAQLILSPIVACDIVEVKNPILSKGRGEAGFGSTGL